MNCADIFHVKRIILDKYFRAVLTFYKMSVQKQIRRIGVVGYGHLGKLSFFYISLQKITVLHV